jgi:hypothetical protein
MFCRASFVCATRTCGAARSARRPVKAEVAGSNPVRSATELALPQRRAIRFLLHSANFGAGKKVG